MAKDVTNTTVQWKPTSMHTKMFNKATPVFQIPINISCRFVVYNSEADSKRVHKYNAATDTYVEVQGLNQGNSCPALGKVTDPATAKVYIVAAGKVTISYISWITYEYAGLICDLAFIDVLTTMNRHRLNRNDRKVYRFGP